MLSLLVLSIFGSFSALAGVCHELPEAYRCQIVAVDSSELDLKQVLVESEGIRLRKVIVEGATSSAMALKMGSSFSDQAPAQLRQRVDLYAEGDSRSQSGEWKLIADGPLHSARIYVIYQKI